MENVKRIQPVQSVSNNAHKYYFDNNRVYREKDNEPVSEIENMGREAINDFIGRNYDETIY